MRNLTALPYIRVSLPCAYLLIASCNIYTCFVLYMSMSRFAQTLLLFYFSVYFSSCDSAIVAPSFFFILSLENKLLVLFLQLFLFQFKDSIYEVYREFKMSWNDAEDVCISNGGHLWSINSHEEWFQIFEKKIPIPTQEKKDTGPASFTGGHFNLLHYDNTFIGLKLNKDVRFIM